MTTRDESGRSYNDAMKALRRRQLFWRIVVIVALLVLIGVTI